MAESSTIARPYATALFQAATPADAPCFLAQLDVLANLSKHESLRQFASSPKVDNGQVFNLIIDLADHCSANLSLAIRNLLSTVIDNGRLAILPEIATQFRSLVNERSGIADAYVVSAFPIDETRQADLLQTLEKRFGRQLNLQIEVDPSLIGGVRVRVGDQVLDASVHARLQRMRSTLMH